jgi:hypothetical protein
MMKRNLLITAFLLAAFALPAGAQDNLNFSGYLRNYTGVLTGQDNAFSILQNTFDFQVETRGSRMALKVNPYLYHYFDRDLELGIREAYLDLYFEHFDLRVGKQQIIYGKAEGVFITDVVSPKDLREFLLPEFDEIRMGVTAARLNYYRGNNTFELVWVPVFTPTVLPEEGSIWRPQMLFPVEPDYDLSTARVDPELGNSEVFLRYSAMTPGIDFELVGGTFFDDDPVMHMTRHVNPETMQLTGLTVRPQHHRLLMGGGSFSTQLGPFLLRGEAGYSHGKYFQTSSQSASDGTIEKDLLHYMMGMDYTLMGVRLTAQFIQEYIPDYTEGILNEESENMMTFLARKDFLREKLWLEVFSYVGINRGDALIRPKVSYSFADGFDIQLGANIFTGTEGRFGQYHENDMLYMKMKYSF